MPDCLIPFRPRLRGVFCVSALIACMASPAGAQGLSVPGAAAPEPDSRQLPAGGTGSSRYGLSSPGGPSLGVTLPGLSSPGMGAPQAPSADAPRAGASAAAPMRRDAPSPERPSERQR
jgi:hypothetical protein